MTTVRRNREFTFSQPDHKQDDPHVQTTLLQPDEPNETAHEHEKL